MAFHLGLHWFPKYPLWGFMSSKCLKDKIMHVNNSYTMVCLSVSGDNPRALASYISIDLAHYWIVFA